MFDSVICDFSTVLNNNFNPTLILIFHDPIEVVYVSMHYTDKCSWFYLYLKSVMINIEKCFLDIMIQVS